MVIEVSVLFEQWRAAERRASKAELALMKVLRSDEMAAPAQVQELRTLRASASERLAAILSEVEKSRRSCHPAVWKRECI